MSGPECEQALREIHGFLDGSITDDTREAIRTHLDECGPCLEAHDFEDAVKKMLADKCRDTVPEQLRPPTVHRHPWRKRILRIHQPFRQAKPVFRR